MSRSFAHFRLIGVLITIALSFSRASAQSQPPPSSADALLQALYTEEWNWRQQELGRGEDHFPHVDAASQQARLAYWTRTLATLDTIPFDQLSPEEKINAQIFRTSIRALASDVQYRTYEAAFNSDTFFWNDFTPTEEKLGARFDQRRFHDAILAIGSVPLPVLAERMARFIADESAASKR
jgi:uncharacterized protein (DUF885 family)